jgi:hypothetical protein
VHGWFAAFATEEARNSWGDASDLQAPESEAGSEVSEFGFRAGGRECFTTVGGQDLPL